MSWGKRNVLFTPAILCFFFIQDGVKVEGERGKSSMLSIAIKALVFILVLLAMAYVGIKVSRGCVVSITLPNHYSDIITSDIC